MAASTVVSLADTTVSPDNDAIRRTAAEVISRPEYQVDRGLTPEAQALWQTVLGWILSPLFWLFERLNGLPMPVRILVTALLSVLLVVLVIHMVWSFVAAVRQTKTTITRRAPREQKVDPSTLEASAEQAAAAGEYLEAARLLFRAAILRIEGSEKRRLRVGITNRELLRRYRSSALSEPLSRLVDVIDRKWYGAEDCVQADYEQCRSEHARIQTLTHGSLDAVSA